MVSHGNLHRELPIGWTQFLKKNSRVITRLRGTQGWRTLVFTNCRHDPKVRKETQTAHSSPGSNTHHRAANPFWKEEEGSECCFP
jgi:hypothetical protein